MSERGVFAVDRGVFDHPLFAPEPFTEREAWIWLLSAAAWRSTRVRAGRAVVTLERGQCAFALRFMARRFKWSDSRVRRFLKRLENDAAVTTLATHETTLITICNYGKYQFGRRVGDARTDAQTDASATRRRRKEEESKNLITKKDSEGVSVGNGGKRERWTPPPHGAVSKKRGTIYCKLGTPEWAQYAEDFRQHRGFDPIPDKNDGKWFKRAGECAA